MGSRILKFRSRFWQSQYLSNGHISIVATFGNPRSLSGVMVVGSFSQSGLPWAICLHGWTQVISLIASIFWFFFMESNQSSFFCEKDGPVQNTKSSNILHWRQDERMGCADSSSSLLLLLPLYGRIYVIPPPGDVNRLKTNLRTLIRISFDAPYLDEEYNFQSRLQLHLLS